MNKDVIRSDIAKMRDQFAMALQKSIPTDRFVRVVQSAIMANADLMRADRTSLMSACMKAAQDGLLPDGREGALVMFGNSAQWMPMVYGLQKKARNSGEISSIYAHVAYENDRVHILLGDDERIEHEPNLSGDRGKPRLIYAIAKMKDGTLVREWMSVKDVEKVRAVSRTKNKGPWVDWWDEMAKKTAIRRLCKHLPMSTDKEGAEAFMRAVERDDEQYDLRDPKDVTPETKALPSDLDEFGEDGQEAETGNGHDPETGEVAKQPEPEPQAFEPPAEPPADPLKIRGLSRKQAVETLEHALQLADAKHGDSLTQSYGDLLDKLDPDKRQRLERIVVEKLGQGALV